MSNNEHRDPQDAGEDVALRRAWREASDEIPPSELDAAIVAAARKSVQDRGSAAKTASDGKRSRNWFMQWQPLAAMATVAGLAFMLLQVLPRDREVIPPIRMDESAPGPVTARPGATELPSTERAAAPAGAADAVMAEQKTSGELAGSTNVYVPAPSAGAAADQEAAAPASEARQRDEATMNATQWATRVEALYASGDLDGAADALRAFRSAEPDADSYLPEPLRNWARTVK